MRIKKRISLLMTLVILLTLFTACARDNNSDENTTANASNETTEATTSSTNETNAVTQEQSTDYAGSVINGTYQNAYFDLSFTPASGWTFYTEDQLLTLNDFATGLYEGLVNETFNNRIEQGGSLSVMMASNLSGENVNIVVQQTPVPLKTMNAISYCASIVQPLEEQYKAIGFTEANVELGSAMFKGEGIRLLCVSLSSTSMAQKQMFIPGGEYTCIITVSGHDFTSADAILGCFSDYDPNAVASSTNTAPSLSVENSRPTETRPSIAATLKDFAATLSSYVDPDHYLLKEDEGYCTYTLKKDVAKTTVYNLDYTIDLGGTPVTLPLTYGELVQAGWTSTSDPSSSVKSSDGIGIFASCQNTQKKWFYATIVNRTGTEQQLKDCNVVSIQIKNYEYDYTVNNTVWNDEAAPFTICGSIKNTSSLKEITEVLGEPTTIFFYEETCEYNSDDQAYIQLNYTVRNENEYGSLTIVVSAETDEIMKLTYDHELAS